MELYLADDAYQIQAIVNGYKSAIWTERYNSSGDFAFLVKNTNANRALFETYGFLANSAVPRRMMVIETVERSVDYIKVSGRSFDSILDRRVITACAASSTLTELISNLIKAQIGINAHSSRIVTGIVSNNYVPAGFTNPTDFGAIPFGDNLHTAIYKLLKAYDLGLYVEKDPGTLQAHFNMYYGSDRSIGSNAIMFSEGTGNISEVVQLKSTKLFKNQAYVNLPPWDDTPGLGELFQKFMPYEQGMERRELWVDGSPLRQDSTFNATNKPTRAVALGAKELGGHKKVDSLTFNLTSHQPFIFGEDYFLGDLVAVVDLDGRPIPHRVTEYIYTNDDTGRHDYPTLTVAE